jgi:replication factor A1
MISLALFHVSPTAVDMMILGKLVYLRNAKIDMFKGSMRLAVDKWGLVQEADQEADFTPKVRGF